MDTTQHHRPSAHPHERCSIVPPFLLRRLETHPNPAVQDLARATLATDAALRSAGRLPARRARISAAAPGAGVAPDRIVHDAHNGQQLPGEPVRREGEPAVADVSVNEAYDGLGSTWELFSAVYGRDSLDGNGLALLATVHYGTGYANAFWDGEQMVFGDGDGEVFGRFTGAVDIIGHELTHGITELTAGLRYQGQSGALNESVSDVFGSLVKQRVAGQTAEAADWLIGAGLFTPAVQGVALRSLKAPGTAYDDDVLGTDPQPATMADYVDTTDDNGGVHINSGIPNHAFYLAAVELGGNAWERAGQVWFDVLVGGGLPTDADFATFADATVTAAVTRFGEGSPEAAAVSSAWQRVGVLTTTTPTPRDGPVPADVTDPQEHPPQQPGPGQSPEDAAATPVYLCRTGGFGGLTLECTFTPAELGDPASTEWSQLLSSGTLPQLTGSEPAPDRYVYRVVAEPRHLDVTIGEQDVSDGVRDLFERTLRLPRTRL